MKLPGEYLDSEMEKLRSSNNQQEILLEIHSKEIRKIKLELQKIKDENERRKSQEF